MNYYLGEKYFAQSAGTEPKKVHPLAIEALTEIGIDISKNKSKSAKEFIDRDFDYVITVCDNAREICPFFPNGKKILHKSFEDPTKIAGEEPRQKFREVRDKIKEWILSEF